MQKTNATPVGNQVQEEAPLNPSSYNSNQAENLRPLPLAHRPPAPVIQTRKVAIQEFLADREAYKAAVNAQPGLVTAPYRSCFTAI